MEEAKVLLVDDEKDFNDTVVKRLCRRHMQAASAYNGQDALDFLERSEMDVVVLDVKMPGMDGLETLREIKKRFPRLEVIMLTGHASVESGVQGMALGAYDYLMKPVELDTLVDKIHQAQERKLLSSARA